MKKLLFNLGLVGVLVSAVSRVEAVPYRDIDVVNRVLNASVPSYTGNLNIVTGDGGFGDLAGYNPQTQTITAAYALFAFFNLLTGNESQMRIDLDAHAFVNNTSLPIGVSLWGGSVTGDALLALGDGNATYTVTRTSGQFRLVSAGLFVEASPRSSVPDAGMTLSLLGIGILGLGFFRRKLI